ncbi:MAG: MFS transporter [Candidatus Nanopelagicales bacterium]|jgi:NNP family nitrate/nitrite transporter-like MFS transporter|nr:MFS transporter [Candidatus Nanopelagicales bacterium]MCU0298407.1 MFS transporter [Candidatus Nanopelagicales bacterium]
MSAQVSGPPQRKGGDWLDSWNPEDAATWDSGRAWKTLWITTFNLTLAFVTWFLVSGIATKLNNIGFNLSSGQLYWLVAMPGLAGGTLRLIWTFLPPLMGTRKLVSITTALLLLPLVGWAFAIQDPSTPYAVLMLLAALAGIGGGAFSGFMPSTSYFFPKAKQGTALGLQAGIGNFGVSLVQFVTPWIVSFAMLWTVGDAQRFVDAKKGIDKEVWYQNAALVWIPFVIVGAILAWFLLKSVPVQAKGVKEQFDIFSNKHTWLMTLLYVITFGTFSGFAAVFAVLIKNKYGSDVFGADGIDPLKYAFWGALVGSAARIIAGPISDKFGGGKVTAVSALGIALATVFTAFQLNPTSADQFPMFFWGMLAIFFFAGVGNASTFKQMPMIFEPRQAGGVIGWTAAIAAYGPFVFGVVLAVVAPMIFFIVWAVLAASGVWVAWYYYARPGAEKPS